MGIRMLNTLRLFHELEATLDPRAAETIADIIGRVYDDLQNTVTKTEFRELTAIVQDLGDAQKRTEARVEELAEAQKRTEHIVQQLTRKVAENTEKIDDLRTQVGGLSATVGYGLEDKAYHALPRLLRQDFGIETKEPLYRRHVPDNKGKPIEVNIFGAAVRDGQPVQIIGEAKNQLSQRKIDEFLRKKVRRLHGVYPSLFPILITYMISVPEVAAYADKKGVHLYYSYQFTDI
jgi:uncharacterized coiled-coil protein SlyX